MILIIITFHVVETFLRINVFPVCLFSPPPLCLKNARCPNPGHGSLTSLCPDTGVRLQPSKQDNGVSRGAKRCTVH